MRDAPDHLALRGTILERKYRIDDPIAEGGFGIVYAGHHLGLDVPIAIKVLKPPAQGKSEHWDDRLAAFLVEGKTLARLRHPNIVTVLDSGVTHVDAVGMDLPWIVLEWLDGETLAEHLAKRRGTGGMSQRECWTLMRPVLDAVAVAHEAGLVHRDIKASNIMLVRATGEPRVLDFGIAKMMTPDEAPPSGDVATDSHVTVFTLASAAPEQLAGGVTGPWTDVFSLGLLITEMLSGREASSLDRSERYASAFGAVRPTPASFGVDAGGWEPILAKATAVRSVDRPKNARALLVALEGALGQKVATRGARFGGRWRVAAIAGALVLAMGAGARYYVHARDAEALVFPDRRPYVVLLPFRGEQSATPRIAAVEEIVGDHLRLGDAIRTPPPDARGDVKRMIGDLPTLEAVARVRTAMGADVAIACALHEEKGTLRGKIEIYDAAHPEHVANIDLAGPANDVVAFARDAAVRVRRRLGRPQLSVEDDTALRSVIPDNAEALTAYVEGLSARRHFRLRDAATRFEETVRLSPRYAPGWSLLAQTRWLLDEDARAAEDIRNAVKLAPGLPRADELAIYALAAEITSDWKAAVDQYGTLLRVYPDRVEYATALGRALVRSGRPGDAVELLEGMKARPLNDWERMRVLLIQSFAYDSKGDDHGVLAASEEAAQLASRIDALGAFAVALQNQASVHRRAGRLDVAAPLYEKARAQFLEIGDEGNAMGCDAGLASLAEARGEYDAALALYERMLKVRREQGTTWAVASLTVSIGNVYAATGRLALARQRLDEGGKLFEEIGNRAAVAERLVDLASIDIELGSTAGQKAPIEAGRAIYVELGKKSGLATADARLARIAHLEGRLADAEAAIDLAYREAVDAARADLIADVALERAMIAFDRGAPTESERFEDSQRAAATASVLRRVRAAAFASRRALARGDVTDARRFALEADVASRASSVERALALAAVLDAFGAEGDAALSSQEIATRAAELAALLPATEAIVTRIAALVALSRHERGADRVARLREAHEIAQRHLLPFAALALEMELALARGAPDGARSAEAALIKMQAVGVAQAVRHARR